MTYKEDIKLIANKIKVFNNTYSATVVSLLPRVHEKTVPSLVFRHNCVEDLNAF